MKPTKLIRLLICIDDTDNLDSKGTGAIAEELRDLITAKNWGICGDITRHQLLLHEDIPYTSHNSSMCFDCTVDADCYEELIPLLYNHLEKESAEGSDPGISVMRIDDPQIDKEALFAYGMSAKTTVLVKEQAYTLAKKNGIYLNEAGGTGQGVIGALAGIALRLGGNDGEAKGGEKSEMEIFKSGEIYTAAQIKGSGWVKDVCDVSGYSLTDDEEVLVPWKVKPILLNGDFVVLVRLAEKDGEKAEKKAGNRESKRESKRESNKEIHREGGKEAPWSTMEKEEMRNYGDWRLLSGGCDRFEEDMKEEQVCAPSHSCFNCRYRRWLANGFTCAAKPIETDVLIIGAGVVGSFVARHLTKSNLSVALLEKNNDVCCEVTKANTAIVHPGYSGKPSSIKAKMTVAANNNFDNVCEELQVEFIRCGSMILASGDKGEGKFQEKIERGAKNGVKGMRILSREEVLAMEPNINPNITMALYAPSTGVVNPWEFGLAAAENAVDNGARLYLNTEVKEIKGVKEQQDGYLVTTDKGSFAARFVINCAGLHSDKVSEMVAKPFFKIKPRKGEYFLFDPTTKGFVNSVIFQAWEDESKGVIIAPTVHGGLLVGPSAVDVDDKSDSSTEQEGLDHVRKVSEGSVSNLPFEKVIRSFAGLRARPNLLKIDPDTQEVIAYEDDVKDFIIGSPEGCDNFINVAGIKSPGLTCADEIGKYVAEMLFDKIKNRGETLEMNGNFNPCRKKRIRFAQLPLAEQQRLASEDRNYAKIICRCSQVTLAEVLDSIHRNAGATTVDGVKRRAGTGLGRCQGSFCTSEIINILAKELGVSPANINKDEKGSFIVTGSVV